MRYIISLLLTSAALPAMAAVPNVVADLPPIHSLVAQVMGDLGQPVLLLEQGANAHSFQLRPSQAASLAAADLVVWVGPEMTPWLERALDGLSGAQTLPLLDASGTRLRDYDTEAGHDEADAEAEAEAHDEAAHDAESHDEEAHDHAGLDPHAWLDPGNARLWLELIAAELARLDPENAAAYAANATAAQARIDGLDAELTGVLAPVKTRSAVVFHQAYGYFASHYGLTIAAAIAEGDAAAPGAQHLAAVQAVLAQGPACLFPEANHDPKLALQLAEATGAKLGAALDPEGATLPPGPELYADLMRGLATGMAGCLTD